jgi:hypothetical protein
MIHLKYIGKENITCIFGDFIPAQAKLISSKHIKVAQDLAILPSWKIEDDLQEVEKEIMIDIEKRKELIDYISGKKKRGRTRKNKKYIKNNKSILEVKTCLDVMDVGLVEVVQEQAVEGAPVDLRNKKEEVIQINYADKEVEEPIDKNWYK